MNTRKILSPLDYRRLLSTSVNLWSEEELSQFLIWDHLDAFGSTHIAKDLPAAFIKDSYAFVEKYKRYLPIFRFIDWMAIKIIRFFLPIKKKKKIVFVNFKLNDVINKVKENYNISLVVQGKVDRLFAIKNFIEYVGVTELYSYIADYLKSNDVKHLYKLIEQIEKKLKIIKPDCIVFGLDVLPIERAIALAAKKISIPTLVVQHGLQDLSFPLFDGRATDYVLVWGEYFKQLWASQNIKEPSKIYILGYPHIIVKNLFTKNKNHKKVVCFLAQDYERYNKDFLPVKIETVKKISLFCEKNGLEFIYRPHPGDNRKFLKNKLPNIYFTPKKEKLETTFSRADVFVSFSSTALVEASMAGKNAIQLMNYPIVVDNFEQLGACDKSFKTIDELEYYLTEMIKSSDFGRFKSEFDNNYIETRLDANRHFLEILAKIIKE